MKKFLTKISLFAMTMALIIRAFLAPAYAEEDFNWVQWYEGMGMGTVIGEIMKGNMTTFEACEKIVIPASKAGLVEQGHIDFLIECYPEAKAILEMNGVPVGTTPNADPTPAPTPVTPAYTIEDCDMYKYATTDVNVRVEPDTNAGRVGSVEQNGYAHITGITSNGWYRLEYNGITGFSVQKYFADKPIEIIEEVTDVPEPTAEPTPAPTEAPTPEPTAEPKTEVKEEATPAPTPTATPESDTKTTIVQPVDEATPAPTATPKEEATATPDSAVVTPTEAPKTEVKEEATPTEAPVAEVTTGTEPTTVPATQGVPQTEETNVVPYIIGGGILLIAGIVAGVIIFKKK